MIGGIITAHERLRRLSSHRWQYRLALCFIALGIMIVLACGCQCNKCEPLNCEEVTPMNAAQCMGQERE